MGRPWAAVVGAVRSGLEGVGGKSESEDAFPEPVGDEAMITTFRELPCLAVYAYVAIAAALCAVWVLYRQARHRAVRARAASAARLGKGGLKEPLLSRPEKPRAAPPYRQSMTDSQSRVITFEGYRGCPFGTCVSWLLPTTTGVFVAVFATILFDYYYGCTWEWPAQLCYVGTFPIFGSFNTNSYVFMVVWSAGVVWFSLLVWGSHGSMANLFRLRVPLVDAEYVHMTVEEKRQVISSGYSRVLRLRDAAARLLGRLAGGPRGLPGGLFSLSGGPSQTVALQRSPDGTRFLDFRCSCYALEERLGLFHEYDPSSALPEGGHAALQGILDAGGLRLGGDGLDEQGAPVPTVERLYRAAGPNEIPFTVDAWKAALKEEFATFFFLYQFSIYAVCLWFSYWHYTIIALGVAIISACFNVSIKIRNQKAIKAMMEQSSRVTVMRSSQEMEIDSRHIVPGDIVKVESNGWLVPCDLLLLRGAAVSDESTLTGESMPVQRLAPTEPLKTDGKGQRFPAKHVLVAGTEVLQVSDGTWAVATHTGVGTQKGQLMLLILYPPKLLFKYDEQLGVVFLFLITYAIFVAFTTMKMMYVLYAQDQNLPLTATWASAVFCCSCVVPTMLHIVLSVGQVVAAERLQKRGIFCAAPKRITLGGKVRVVCFDKTGTLTTPSLEFFGVHCVQPPEGAGGSAGPFGGWVSRVAAGGAAPGEEAALEPEERRAGWAPEVLCGLASAHSLSPFDGSETGVVGNAVEVNMFRACGWSLPSQTEAVSGAPGPEQKVTILRRFDFSHVTMTMSAVVAHAPSGERGVYCKGSFEQVAARCAKGSVPAAFAAKAQRHAYSGMYVLALAGRPLKPEEGGKIAALTREDAEKDLVMLGLLLFKNPLRGDTRDAIERLREGEVRSVMITGDAPGTAIKIAKEASLVQSNMPVLLGDVEAGGSVVWRSDPEDLSTLNELLLSNEWLTWRREYQQWRQGNKKGSKGEAGAFSDREGMMVRSLSWHLGNDAAEAGAQSQEDLAFSTEELVLSRLFEWCELSVTQRALEWLEGHECSPDLRRVLVGSRRNMLKKGKALESGKGQSSLAWELMTNIRIFARMTPTGKVSVVESLMSQGLICAMVGDGGNDSGALRAAHVGMALSSATAATVVAPFTTNRGSVAPIADICREGRGALATSFAGYKFCVHYGLLNSSYKFVNYYYGTSQTMAANYFQDIGGFLSLSYAMTLAKPAPTLVGDRPTSSLFSVYTMASVLGMWIINIVCLRAVFMTVISHEDYVKFPVHLVLITQWWKLSRNWENTCVFFCYSFQFFWSSVVFSFGHLFRLAWYQNAMLFAIVAAAFGSLSAMLLGPPNDVTRLFHLALEREEENEPWTPESPCPAMPYDLRLRLFSTVMACLITSAFWEKVIVQGNIGARVRNRCRRMSKHITVRL